MGDRIAVLKDGLLQQVGSPRELYERPANMFVAGFIGSPAMNLIPSKISSGGVEFGNTVAKVEGNLDKKSSDAVTVGIRPEDLTVNKDKGHKVKVDVVEELGADGYLYGHIEIDGVSHNITVRVDGRNHPMRGDEVFVMPVEKHIHVFDAETGERISGAVSA
jgi:multiple sugar transport system ATP-binding protein